MSPNGSFRGIHPGDHHAPPGTSQWKAAYLTYLEENKDTYVSFALVYLDDDEIPELYLSGNCEAVGDAVCSWQSGKIAEVHLNRIDGGSYAERSGVLINQNGNMGHSYTHVYQLTGDGFILTFPPSMQSVCRMIPMKYPTNTP